MIYSQEAVYRLLVKNAEMLHTLTYLTAIKLKNDAIFPEDGCLKKKVWCVFCEWCWFLLHICKGNGFINNTHNKKMGASK